MDFKKTNYFRIVPMSLFLLVIVSLVIVSLRAWSTSSALKRTELALASSTQAYNLIIRNNRDTIATLEDEKDRLVNSLTAEQKKTFDLQTSKENSDKEINNLIKLVNTDPELLKKYSKVYFLSENYVPSSLVVIDRFFVINPERSLMISAPVESFLNEMLDAATVAGVPLRIASAYRSFGEQKDLKSSYKVTYGAGTANQFSAEQGYSEHQLGTTLDFTTPTLKGTDLSFENSTSFAWLNANAYKYGFVLSYPKSNTYYQYEPWHWRFVGRALAKDLHDNAKYFYEYDQRQIDPFLLRIYD